MGYRDDIGKYASAAQAVYLRHCLENIPYAVGRQISYNHFADSDYRSREISRAFDTLEFAQLVTRVFSSHSLTAPLVQNRKKAPKLVFLDVGLVNYKIGQREKLITLSSLENVFQGRLSEQIVGQMLRALGESAEQPLSYWYRDKRGSSAEVDYLLSWGTDIIPIEVKAGSNQKIHSLYSLIDERYKAGVSSTALALRISSGPLAQTLLKTKNSHEFVLLSVPYYLVFRIRELLGMLRDRPVCVAGFQR